MVELLSTEYPNEVGVRPSHPTLCARTHTGEETLVPFTGAATVISDADAGLDKASPESAATAERITRRRSTGPKKEQDGRCMNNVVLPGKTNQFLADSRAP